MTIKNEENMVRAGYYIPEKFKKELEDAAFQERRSASYILTELLGKWSADRHSSVPASGSSK